MPIKLVTGLPGCGKSLYAVAEIQKAAAERPVYVYGIDGLQPFAGWEPLEHPDNWQDLPDGSLIVVDEAQKVWPSSRGGDPTPPVRALSEHRHRGFDFILLTQHPTMMHSYVRKLVSEHRHQVRQFGTQSSRIFTWSEAQDDPQSLGTRERATDGLWAYPKACYGLYKSATLHTVKRRIPFRFWLMAAAAVFALAMIPMALGALDSLTGSDQTEVAAESVSRSEPDSPASPYARNALTTPEAYAKRFEPLIEGLPWSAPAYADRKPTTTPQIFCMSSDRNCVCMSEQGTRILVQDGICRHIARYGVYNPLVDADDSKRRTRDDA